MVSGLDELFFGRLVFVQELEGQAEHCVRELIGLLPNLSRNARNGTTAFAIARWPPALPTSAKYFRTNSPALREYPRFRTDITSASLTMPETIVHLTSSSCR